MWGTGPIWVEFQLEKFSMHAKREGKKKERKGKLRNK